MNTAVVVGGGLAGMVAARELASAGWRVTLLESSEQLGGKAQAFKHDVGWVEHGYHVFPAWYDNVRRLLKELDVSLIDFDRYFYLRRAEFPKMTTVYGPSGFKAIMHNTFRGLLPWYHTLLFGYSVIDMISRPLRHKRLLDCISQVGLMRSAWYVTESVATLNQENILKASAIPAYEMSAMTAKNIAAFWVQRGAPFLSVLPGDLQTTFIMPLIRACRDAGVEIRTGTHVASLRAENGIIDRVVTLDGEEFSADTFVVTTPLEVTRRFVTGEIYDVDPELGNIHHLEAEPMSALHVYLKRRLEGVPREHVFLHESRYGMSVIDLDQIWDDQSGTVLSCISSNFSPLKHLEESEATEHLLRDLLDFVPFDRSDIAKVVLHSNVQTPLFINTVGAWPHRPPPNSKIPNLFVAGDWVKTPVDLACMEGAVSSAYEAASHALAYANGDLPKAVLAVAPATPPRWLTVIARYALIPIVAPVWTIARLTEWLKR